MSSRVPKNKTNGISQRVVGDSKDIVSFMGRDSKFLVGWITSRCCFLAPYQNRLASISSTKPYQLFIIAYAKRLELTYRLCRETIDRQYGMPAHRSYPIF